MYLIKLVVESKELDTVIRDIPFKNGLNLIVDNGKIQKSGNDIGKTTFLRAIDFCLGAMSNELYVDRDENKENKEIKKFLVNQKISFTLYIGTTLDIDHYTHKLQREFIGEDNKDKPNIIQSINGRRLKIGQYNQQLNEVFFQYDGKPSFRDLIPKFIREDKNSVDSPLMYLGDYKSDSDYNAIHLLLFGFKNSEALEQRVDLQQTSKKLENKYKVYTDDYGNKNSIEAQIKIKKRNLEKLQEEKKFIQKKITNIINLDSNIDNLNTITRQINSVNVKIIDIELNISNITKSTKRLLSERVKVDTGIVKNLYNEARIYNENLHKNFEDTIQFHNSMIDNKISFAEKNLSKLLEQLDDLKSERKSYLDKYDIEKDFANNELFISLETIDKVIIELSSEILEKDNILLKLSDIDISKVNINQELGKIIKIIEKADTIIKGNVDIFNEFYSDYSNQLYDEEQYLSIGKELTDPFIINNKQNSGSGKKKAYIAAFDLAYTAFLNKVNYNYPKFSAIDLVEVIDTPQLKILFDIANSIDCQFIIPTLKSKISAIGDMKQSEILSLSESERFFRF